MAVILSTKRATWISEICLLHLIAKNPPGVLDLHFVRDAGFGQADKLGERCMRAARAAGQQGDQASDRGVAVAIQPAQVSVSCSTAGGAVDP